MKLCFERLGAFSSSVPTFFGDGHRPVNCPINAQSAKESATRMVSSRGKATTGTSSILLSNFNEASLVVFLLYEATSLVKSSFLVGIGGGIPDPPSPYIIGSCVGSEPVHDSRWFGL